MAIQKAKPETIAGYIKAQPKEVRAKLKEMDTLIKAVAPGATEGLKWGMPAYSYKRILVTFMAHKHHIGFYPTPSAVKAFTKDLTNYKTAKGSIQFPLDKPLPKTLIKRITAFRVMESLTADGKWKT